jgi:hypothetical protein
VIGTASDTDLSDPAQVTLFVEDGIRFVIHSRHGPTVSFDLTKSEYRQFDDGATKIARDIHD